MKLKVILLALVAQLVVGCSINAPEYQPNFNSINILKELNTPDLTTGSFVEVDPKLNSITLRGNPLKSPYDGSFAAYLKHSVEEQLRHADKWDENSELVINATLLKNDVDASGFSVGEADLSAEFTLVVRGKEVYRKTHSIHHEWPSSFVGAVAIPDAANNYPVAVQKLIDSLFADPEFAAIIEVLNGV